LPWFSSEFLSQIPLEAIATRPAGIQDYRHRASTLIFDFALIACWMKQWTAYF
jgi:hypothetical protein